MAKGDDLEKRLLLFAVRVMKVCDGLPPTVDGRHIAQQLLRAGTAGAPNYAEGRSAESKRDFVHKLRIALKELNETRIWLTMLAMSEMVTETRLTDLQAECEELCKILYASIQTAQKSQQPKING
jgi:four helix bundle protein